MPKDTPDSQALPVPDANAQAKAALPKPELAKPWEDEPTLPSAPTSGLGQAYAKFKDFLSEHEQHFSDSVLKPFRQGLDNMAEDLQNAGETGHTQSGGKLNDATRALASGTGEMLKMVPVGKDVKETAAMAIVPPELEELGVQLHPEQIIKDTGLIYKGELTKGSGVHMFEHPDNPGMTAALHEDNFTHENVQKKMQSKLDEFGVQRKKVEKVEKIEPKSVAKNASGDSAASQEAINRGKSQATQGISHVRRDTRSGKEIPLNSIDAVDAKAGPYEQIVQKNKTGETILDSGEKARQSPVSGQQKSGTDIKFSAKPKQKSENPKEVSKLASDYLETLKKKSN